MWPFSRKKGKKPAPRSPLGVTPDGAWSELKDALTPEPSLTPRQQEIIRWVESGGDINWTCSKGMTLLHYAAMCGNEKMVRFLLEHGANIEAREKQRNSTPLFWARTIAGSPTLPALLEHGANLYAQDTQGYTPMMLIQQFGSEEQQKIAELFVVKTAICSECGAPETVSMRERGVLVKFILASLEFACLACSEKQEIPLNAIDKARGVQVQCSSCSAIVFIPPSVWCKACNTGLSTNWQKQITRG